jgi:hypothetical protein
MVDGGSRRAGVAVARVSAGLGAGAEAVVGAGLAAGAETVVGAGLAAGAEPIVGAGVDADAADGCGWDCDRGWDCACGVSPMTASVSETGFGAGSVAAGAAAAGTACCWAGAELAAAFW